MSRRHDTGCHNRHAPVLCDLRLKGDVQTLHVPQAVSQVTQLVLGGQQLLLQVLRLDRVFMTNRGQLVVLLRQLILRLCSSALLTVRLCDNKSHTTPHHTITTPSPSAELTLYRICVVQAFT